MSKFMEGMKEAAAKVAANERQNNTLKADSRKAALSRRPRLTAETIFQSLDWVLDHLDVLGEEAATHMQAIELGIRTMATHAQGKATQHTLVEEGLMAPPPSAS